MLRPKGTDADPKSLRMFLQAVGTPPLEAMDFQLWMLNHKNADKSAMSGRFAVSCSLQTNTLLL